MSKAKAETDFRKAVKIALVEQDKKAKWLIEEVAKRTGLYFDDSYLSKILNGKNNNPKIVEAIKDILGI